MFRWLARSACGMDVIASKEDALLCANSSTYKLYAAGIFMCIGFFVVLVITITKITNLFVFFL